MLSVVISAFNEEKKVQKCLESVKWADEIIFVDNSSTDDTAKIAKKFTSKIFSQKNDPLNIDLQKNFGIEKCKGEWILLLDADEVVTTELADQIRGTLAGENKDVSGYWIPRKNIIFGKWIRHTGWYPDDQLRLFRRGKGKFEKAHVHEPPVVKGETSKLSEHILHYNYENIQQFLSRGLMVYAPNEAQEMLNKGYVFDFKDVITFPLKEFLSRYFAREGYKDGFHGLMLSLLMGFYHFVIFALLWEKKDFAEGDTREISAKITEEFKIAKKELSYWMTNKKIKEEENLLKKTAYKLKRKLLG